MKYHLKLITLISLMLLLSSGAVVSYAQQDKDDGNGQTIVPPPINPPPGQGGPNDPPRDPNNPPRDPNNPPRDPNNPGSSSGDSQSEPTVPTNPDSANDSNRLPDTDGDGISDSDDLCPTTAGVPSNNGCPDDPDPFVPPVLPTLDCYATPAGNYQVWVRPQANDTQPAIGHLNPGTIYSGIGFVIAPDNTWWLAMTDYVGSSGNIGYAADAFVLTSNCPVLGNLGSIDAVYTDNTAAEGPASSSNTLVVTNDIILGDCNDNGIDDLDEYPLPDCIDDLLGSEEDAEDRIGLGVQIIFIRPGRDCNNNGIDDLDEFWPPDCFGKLTTGTNNDSAALPPDDDSDPWPAGIDQADVDGIVLSCGHETWAFIFDDNGVVTGYVCGTPPAAQNAADPVGDTFVLAVMGGDCNNNGIDDLDEFWPPDCFGKKLTADTANAAEDDGDVDIDQGDIDAITFSCGHSNWVLHFEDDKLTGYSCGDEDEDTTASAPIRDCNNNGIDDLDEFWPPDCFGKLTTDNANAAEDDGDVDIDQGDIDAMTLSCGHSNWVLHFEDDKLVGYSCDDESEASSATVHDFPWQASLRIVVQYPGGELRVLDIVNDSNLPAELSLQYVCNILVSNVPDFGQTFAKDRFCRPKPH